MERGRVNCSCFQYFTLKIGDIFWEHLVGVAAVQTDDILEGFLEGHKLFRM
jgi:hypothetical protein